MNSEFAIVEERMAGDRKVLIVDTEKAYYQHQPWRTLGDYGKRRFENLIWLTYPKEAVVVQYR